MLVRGQDLSDEDHLRACRYLLPVLPALLLALPRPPGVRSVVDRVAFDRFMAGACALLLAIALVAVTHRYYAFPW